MLRLTSRIGSMNNWAVGFIYVLTNAAMPDMVKVGITNRLSEDRANDLDRTNVPLPFDIAYRALTSRPTEVERRAHELLTEHRVNPRREFFAVSPEQARDAVRQALLDAGGIESWQSDEAIVLRSKDRLALTLRAGQLVVPLQYFSPVGAADVTDIWEAKSDGDLLELMPTHAPRHVAGVSTNDPSATEDPVPHLNRSEDVPNWSIIGNERLLPGQRLLWIDYKTNSPRCITALFECRDYCQVVNRTGHPRVTDDGVPLVFNMLTEDPSAEAAQVVHASTRLPVPRDWTPPTDARTNATPRDAYPLAPDHWLPQLNRTQRER